MERTEALSVARHYVSQHLPRCVPPDDVFRWEPPFYLWRPIDQPLPRCACWATHLLELPVSHVGAARVLCIPEDGTPPRIVLEGE